MARKERNDVDYFPHPVNHGRKMFYLRQKYGNDGYAVWFMLLEELGKADFHFLNFTDETQPMYLSGVFKVTEDMLIEIINDLVKFGEFDNELWEHQILFSEKFIESISDAYRKRNNSVIDREGILRLIEQKMGIILPKRRSKGAGNPTQEMDNGRSKGAGSTQSKVKYSKVKETKGKDSKENPPPGDDAPGAKKPDFINQVIGIFQEEYKLSRQLDYEITNKGKERAAAGKLVGYFKQKFPDADSDTVLQSMREYFAMCLGISESFLYQGMSLPLIINQFNRINNILKNGDKKHKGATPGELAAIYSEALGSEDE